MKTTKTTTTTTTIKNNIFIFGLLLLLILFTATKAVTPTSQVIISDWIPHYDANGVDICDTDPLNEVCSCPCDSSLVTVTQTFKGGSECLGNGLPASSGQNTKPGLSQSTCAKVGLSPNEQGVCGSGRVCHSSSGKCSNSDTEVDGLRCFAEGSQGAFAYSEANQYCSNKGMRLCSMNEM